MRYPLGHRPSKTGFTGLIFCYKMTARLKKKIAQIFSAQRFALFPVFLASTFIECQGIIC